MSFWSGVAIALAGTGAGIINTIVGSGTLITFPTLLFFGVNPLVANVSNNIGLVAGGVTGAWGYRHELTGQAETLRRLMPMSFLGSIVGASLLLVLPASAFRAIVPVLILIALVLVVAGPSIQARVHPDGADAPVPAWHAPAMAAGVFVAGVYGGYFGAAQGVLIMGLLSALSLEPLQRLNGYKNVLSLIVNFVAATVFVLFARDHIDWLIVVLIAVGAFVGGIIGARIGRRIPPNVLRALILLIGVVAIVKLVWFP
ncbi:sulfite exporter TauE/SafE family protein [Terrabacter sp. NPDC080008]|uniref:sulfite exporter TauE/SafE family protein n=1 Tax=Terrabacter sp. NPDC080008 TaxID=3155176 RepID=UPI00345011C0